MPAKWTERMMQLALTDSQNGLFSFVRYAVVPNVSYSLLGRHEADLLCLSKAGVFHEVEIKVSKADLKKDVEKRHRHKDPLVSFLWFAVPNPLVEDAKIWVPSNAGIVSVSALQVPARRVYDVRVRDTVLRQAYWCPSCSVVRRPVKDKDSKKPEAEQVLKFLRIGIMRMWSQRTAEMQSKLEEAYGALDKVSENTLWDSWAEARDEDCSRR